MTVDKFEIQRSTKNKRTENRILNDEYIRKFVYEKQINGRINQILTKL